MGGIAPEKPEADAYAAEVRFHVPKAVPPGLITSYYFSEVRGPADTEIEDRLMPEWGNLRLGFGQRWDVEQPDGSLAPGPDSTLFGPTSRARLFRARPSLMLGIGFTPQGWATLIGISAGTLADRMVPAEDVVAGIAALREELGVAADDAARVAILDRFFAARVPADYRPNPDMAAMLEAFGATEEQTVEDLARRMGMTPTRLSRWCMRWFGFPAKVLLRRQRFLRTLANMMDPRGRMISEVLDDSYCDQSHFNREFRRFMGMNPRAYFALPRPFLRAAPALRLKEIGAAFQALHRARD